MNSSGADRSLVMRHSASASRSSDRTSGGMPIKATRWPALMPSFFGNGVPEYPGMEALVESPNSKCATHLAFRRVVSLARADVKRLLLRKNLDCTEMSVGDEVGRPVRHRVLAAQFVLDGGERVRHVANLKREKGAAAGGIGNAFHHFVELCF